MPKSPETLRRHINMFCIISWRLKWYHVSLVNCVSMFNRTLRLKTWKKKSFCLLWNHLPCRMLFEKSCNAYDNRDIYSKQYLFPARLSPTFSLSWNQVGPLSSCSTTKRQDKFLSWDHTFHSFFWPAIFTLTPLADLFPFAHSRPLAWPRPLPSLSFTSFCLTSLASLPVYTI